ncbi:hypothetical protein B0H10DRAFT_2156894 [Mycena sp. CBHHK59/15]|nr:hypothetical protein B0H10DRAFT_2156894 [Mycena sp. CBHHK59/15]
MTPANCASLRLLSVSYNLVSAQNMDSDDRLVSLVVCSPGIEATSAASCFLSSFICGRVAHSFNNDSPGLLRFLRSPEAARSIIMADRDIPDGSACTRHFTRYSVGSETVEDVAVALNEVASSLASKESISAVMISHSSGTFILIWNPMTGFIVFDPHRRGRHQGATFTFLTTRPENNPLTRFRLFFHDLFGFNTVRGRYRSEQPRPNNHPGGLQAAAFESNFGILRHPYDLIWMLRTLIETQHENSVLRRENAALTQRNNSLNQQPTGTGTASHVLLSSARNPLPESTRIPPRSRIHQRSSLPSSRALSEHVTDSEASSSTSGASSERFTDFGAREPPPGHTVPGLSDSQYARLVQRLEEITLLRHRESGREDIPVMPTRSRLQLHDSPLPVPQPQFNCVVCMETHSLEDVALVEPCQHMFCRSCMRNHVQSRLEARQLPIYCPTCPTGRASPQTAANPSEIGDELIQILGITRRHLIILEELQKAPFSVPVQCPACRNTVSLDREQHQRARILTCPLPRCAGMWCKQCNQRVSPNARHSCDGEAETQDLARRAGWKTCPGCSILTEKIEGCDHMTCPVPHCHSHFCYACGALIIRANHAGVDVINAVYRHNGMCTARSTRQGRQDR